MIEPIIVRPGQNDGPIAVLDRRVSQSLSGVENREFNSIFVEELEPMLRVRPGPAPGPAAGFSERAQVPVHGEPGPEGIAPVPFEVPVRGADVFPQFLVQFHHVTIGIEDSVLSHHSLLLTTAKEFP